MSRQVKLHPAAPSLSRLRRPHPVQTYWNEEENELLTRVSFKLSVAKAEILRRLFLEKYAGESSLGETRLSAALTKIRLEQRDVPVEKITKKKARHR